MDHDGSKSNEGTLNKLAALTRRQPPWFFYGKSAVKSSFDVFCISQS
jgi:hypothetical protein